LKRRRAFLAPVAAQKQLPRLGTPDKFIQPLYAAATDKLSLMHLPMSDLA
jgi:hypothetical protein